MFRPLHVHTNNKAQSFNVNAYIACMFICVPDGMLGAFGGQKKELELQMVVSHHVGAENRTWILWKSSQCF